MPISRYAFIRAHLPLQKISIYIIRKQQSTPMWNGKNEIFIHFILFYCFSARRISLLSILLFSSSLRFLLLPLRAIRNFFTLAACVYFGILSVHVCVRVNPECCRLKTKRSIKLFGTRCLRNKWFGTRILPTVMVIAYNMWYCLSCWRWLYHWPRISGSACIRHNFAFGTNTCAQVFVRLGKTKS